MLSFESSLSVDYGRDDPDLSGFLLGLAISCAALGGSGILDFLHWRYRPSRQSPYLPSLGAFYGMQENTAVQLY